MAFMDSMDGQGGPAEQTKKVRLKHPGAGGQDFSKLMGPGTSLDDAQGASASYGPDKFGGPGRSGQGPSPEAMLSGGGMGMGGGMSSPTMPTSPTPVSSMTPVPNALPSPSPRAMTSLMGRAGGLLGGGQGLPGETGLDKAEPSSLLMLLSMLNGR